MTVFPCTIRAVVAHPTIGPHPTLDVRSSYAGGLLLSESLCNDSLMILDTGGETNCCVATGGIAPASTTAPASFFRAVVSRFHTSDTVTTAPQFSTQANHC